MNINEVTSKYLKKEDVGQGRIYTVTRVVMANVALPDAAPENKPVVYFAEDERGLVLNKTNVDSFKEIMGSHETDDWINKQVELYDDPSVGYGGKRVGGIRVRKPSGDVPF